MPPLVCQSRFVHSATSSSPCACCPSQQHHLPPQGEAILKDNHSMMINASRRSMFVCIPIGLCSLPLVTSNHFLILPSLFFIGQQVVMSTHKHTDIHCLARSGRSCCPPSRERTQWPLLAHTLKQVFANSLTLTLFFLSFSILVLVFFVRLGHFSPVTYPEHTLRSATCECGVIDLTRVDENVY